MASGPQVLRPAILFAGIDLEKPPPVLGCVADPLADGEGLAADTNPMLAGPLLLRLLVLRVKQIVTVLEFASPQHCTLAGGEFVPALRNDVIRTAGFPLHVHGLGDFAPPAVEVADAEAVGRRRWCLRLRGRG